MLQQLYTNLIKQEKTVTLSFFPVLFYSVFKLFIGLASAAFIDWKLTVSKVIAIAASPVNTNIQPEIDER